LSIKNGVNKFYPPPLKWLTPPPEKNLVHMYGLNDGKKRFESGWKLVKVCLHFCKARGTAQKLLRTPFVF
jgi:hypothetical protein